MKETERLTEELAKKDKPKEFSEQLQTFKEFKARLVKAGVYHENKYDVPLMHRLGAFKVTDNA